MKGLFITIFLLGINCYLLGQCYFHKIYDLNGVNDYANTVITTLDKGFLIAGNGHQDWGEEGFYCIKLDSCGNKQWDQYLNYSLQGGDQAISSLQFIDSTYLFFGRRYDSIEGAADSYLLKLENSGNVIWHKIIDAGFNDRAVMMKQLPDGNLILGGYKFDTLNNKNICFLIKADTAGNVLWQKDQYANAQDYLFSIDLTSDGGFIMGGYTREFKADYDLFLMKTDSSGNQQWRKYYGDLDDQYKGYVVTMPDGGFVQIGYVNKNPNYARAIIRRTDSSGNNIWEMEFGREYFSLFDRVQVDNFGNIIAVGGTSTDSFPEEAPRLWVVKFDSFGDTLWNKTYSYHYGLTHTYAEDFKVLQDNGLILAGYIIPVGILDTAINKKNDMYVLRTDDEGYTCRYAGCDSFAVYKPVSITDVYLNEVINVHPNPSVDYVYLNFPEKFRYQNFKLRLLDIQGRLIEQMDVQSSSPIKIPIQNVTSGLYFLEIKLGDQKPMVQKVVIAR